METENNTKKKRGQNLQPGPGRNPLSKSEPTVRPTVNIPATLLEKILEKEKNVSAYFRRLAEADLKNAI